jgi:hypothetical protein
VNYPIKRSEEEDRTTVSKEAGIESEMILASHLVFDLEYSFHSGECELPEL